MDLISNFLTICLIVAFIIEVILAGSVFIGLYEYIKAQEEDNNDKKL